MSTLALSFELAGCVAVILLAIGTPVAYWLAYSNCCGKFLLVYFVAMANVSPHHSAAVFAWCRDGAGTELRAHAWRIRRGADGGRESRGRDAHRLHRYLRPRAVD